MKFRRSHVREWLYGGQNSLQISSNVFIEIWGAARTPNLEMPNEAAVRVPESYGPDWINAEHIVLS
jgi:hypothetical protein